MPLQNRVTPSGELIATTARGLFMGNRGGRFHRADRTLSSRRWVSRQWICCRLEFSDRHREVWRTGYTELFFLDEVTALAAGHRPCFECRRADARAFAEALATGRALAAPPRAAEMDAILHAERLAGGAQRRHPMDFRELPDGAMIVLSDAPYAVRGGSLLRWTASGYAERRSRPAARSVEVLTPPSILAALKAGYRPRWHPTADN